ncbi:MAG: DNA topoisomerase VI subunit B [Phycisphaerae bacterium]|nr:DNA topoisomerase VI subunit B [Phycisphaerae bacterium]
MEVLKEKPARQMSLDFGEGGSEGMARAANKNVKAKSKAAGKSPVADAIEPVALEFITPAEPQAVRPPDVRRRRVPKAATAESMAAKQRDISVSEFFAKNRHLLGFDNPRKALLTAVKEAVDNSLDACEDALILPKLSITISPVDGSDNKFKLNVTDNGPGIVRQQVPNIFARLLYGSKFHTLKMSRGQQGIGISAAGMYGLLTTGEPVQIITRINPKKPAQHYHVQIDTARNKPDVVLDEECDFDLPTGTSVTITLEGRYQKGKQSVDDYVAQTAMANPHATIIYRAPDGQTYDYPATSHEMPFLPVEIKPHPYGVEIGVLYKMARESDSGTIAEFFRSEFSRVSPALAAQIAKTAKLSSRLKPKKMTLKEAEQLYKAINETKIMAPSSDCIGPIGQENLEDGLRRVVDAQFYTSCTRKPSVYRGNPFLVEAAMAYGFKDNGQENGKGGSDDDREPLMRLSRIANRVPLLYQQSACAVYKAVLDTNWRGYGLSQSKGALPRGQIMLMVHIASVWVPFTSESKEAIAHYPEIIKEIKLAIQECGRRLGMHVRKQRRIRDEMVKRGYIETYLPHIGEALRDILALKDAQVVTVVERLKETLEKSRKI